MTKEIKEKRKALDKNYYDYLYTVLQYVQKMSLSKYVYLRVRDEIICAIYDASLEGTTPERIFKGGHEAYFEKKLRNAKRKTVLEKISSFFFAFFTLFTGLALIVYIYHFAVQLPGSFYSEGIYLYVSSINLAHMFIYGFLGALLSVFIQKNDQKTKRILLIGTSSFGIIVVATFFIIGNYYLGALKINMIVVLLVTVLFSLGGYFLEDYLSKSRCLKNDKNLEK